MAEWQNGGMAEWRNGGMAEWRNGGMAEWQNGKMADGMAVMARMAGMAGMAERMAEWQNGRNWIQRDTYVLFMVHADNDTLIFYSIEVTTLFMSH
jgi:hypothetical protein